MFQNFAVYLSWIDSAVQFYYLEKHVDKRVFLSTDHSKLILDHKLWDRPSIRFLDKNHILGYFPYLYTLFLRYCMHVVLLFE